LLLLHGHPQTHAIWHKVAPCWRSTSPWWRPTCAAMAILQAGRRLPDHGNYAKRAMAADQVALMRHFGFERFSVLAHDRGARVAHRLAHGPPQAVRRLVLLDIAPTLAMYAQTGEAFARAYWHWFFLIQPAPLPERLIEADPAAYVREVMGRRSAGLAPFDPRALAEYQRCLALPGAAHGLCEDYRAAAGIDLEHDRADRDAGRRLQPLLALWGEAGRGAPLLRSAGRVARAWRDEVEGQALPCGHYIAEEAPQALLAKVPALSTQGSVQ
jgi:haloacetate dehalogenase